MKREICTCRALKFAALVLAFALTQGGLFAQTVNIPDEELEATLRAELKKPEGDITVADMQSLTNFEYDGADVYDLTGLEKATNLTHLVLNFWTYQDLTDLSPLAGLTNLKELSISGTQLTDISPLVGLTNLTRLVLGYNWIRDINPLVGLTNLTVLDLNSNGISDISPLAGLTNLTSLDLGGDEFGDPYAPGSRAMRNSVGDISPLAGLTNLTELDLSYNLISDISPLVGLTNLRDSATGWAGLWLNENYIDITPGSPARQIIDELNAIEGLTVEFESQYDPEPLIGGIPMSNSEDWYRCDWWGEYNTAFAPWLFHAQHGFLYRYPESTNESLYLYDNVMGAWCWTGETIYPFIYAFNPPADNVGTDVEPCWLWYFEDSETPRIFGVANGDHAGEFLFFGPTHHRPGDLGNLWCLGDSWTDCVWGFTWRRELSQDLNAAGWAVDFVGTLVSPASCETGQTFDRDHNGIGGITAQEILTNRLSGWLDAVTPDTVLLLLGANDLLQGASGATVEIRLLSIIDQIRIDNPDVVIYLANYSYGFSVPDSKIDGVSEMILTLAVNHTTAQSPIHFVDHRIGWEKAIHVYNDDGHPNEAGMKKMAENWLTAIESHHTTP